jgi:hypothetical protein
MPFVVLIACHLKTVDTSMAACATGQRVLLLPVVKKRKGYRVPLGYIC